MPGQVRSGQVLWKRFRGQQLSGPADDMAALTEWHPTQPHGYNPRKQLIGNVTLDTAAHHHQSRSSPETYLSKHQTQNLPQEVGFGPLMQANPCSATTVPKMWPRVDGSLPPPGESFSPGQTGKAAKKGMRLPGRLSHTSFLHQFL